jgi:hypothetical protein
MVFGFETRSPRTIQNWELLLQNFLRAAVQNVRNVPFSECIPHLARQI